MISTENRRAITATFRVFPEGDVIALWDEPEGPGMISSYQHVGQHSGAARGLIDELRAATAEEKTPLIAELQSIGYDVTDADLIETSEFLEFVDGYTEALKWSTSCDHDGESYEDMQAFEFSPKMAAQIADECGQFFTANHADLVEAAAAYEEKGTNGDTGMAYAGHDFWLTRAGHGAGFWDGDLPKDLGDRLTEASGQCRVREPYIGDDGSIYQ